MIDRAALCNELTETWHREIPIVAAMQISVQSYDGRSLAVGAPLLANRNVHGTTFAGSLYSACVLTGWGAVWLALREREREGVIYARESSVQYRKGVERDFVCRCEWDPVMLAAALDTLATTGRAAVDLVCTIENDGKRAVTFTGTYVVHAKQA